jgi:hypothetical protein
MKQSTFTKILIYLLQGAYSIFMESLIRISTAKEVL